MIVAKFGGSSLQDAERIKHVCTIIKDLLKEEPIIVFSALGKSTDMLLDLAASALRGGFDLSEFTSYHREVAAQLGVDVEHEIAPLFSDLEKLLGGVSLLREFSPRTRDYVQSFGERLSVRIITPYLVQQGINAERFDGWEAGIVTNSMFNEAEVLEESYVKMKEVLEPVIGNRVTPIVTGFISKDKEGHITTLGRGGSDLTASLIGAALQVKEIQVWKDVDGILTTDPRLVPSAKHVPIVSFEEASELAYFGAKVLHPLSIRPAMRTNIPVRIKNSYNREHEGSLILAEISEAHRARVKAITVKENVTLVDIVSMRMLGQYGFLAKVFEIFDRHKTSVDMVATSEVSVSLTVDHNRRSEEGIAMVIDELVKFSRVSVEADKAIVSLICDVDATSEILAGAFATLSKNNIQVEMISQGASKVNIGLVVSSVNAHRALSLLHEYFFPQEMAA